MTSKKTTPHRPLRALDVDEPGPNTPVVRMCEAMDANEAKFYLHEHNVIDLKDKSMVIFREIEAKFGFVGGSHDEYLAYFHRKDIDPTLWDWQTSETVRAITGYSTVEKKDPSKLRKLLMACATNYLMCSGKQRENHGLHGGGALANTHIESDNAMGAAMDESNAFTSVETPPWMWSYMACPPVKLADVISLVPDCMKQL